MSRAVLDASVVIALLFDEPGADVAKPHLESSVMSTVNLAEVQAKLVQRGMPAAEASRAIMRVVREFVDFDATQAIFAGSLIELTKTHGLSLGDRACLALGHNLQGSVFTTDQAWKKVPLGIPIHVIR
jgi:ribonuclease VapC